jgi:hypothetical protein
VPTGLSGVAPKGLPPRQNWGKFEAPKWGGFTARLETYTGNGQYLRAMVVNAVHLSRIWCGKADSGGRHQTILGRL